MITYLLTDIVDNFDRNRRKAFSQQLLKLFA